MSRFTQNNLDTIWHLFLWFLSFERLLLKRGEGVKHTPSTQHSKVAEMMMITLILNCRDSFIIIKINIQKENATLFFWG